MRNISTKRLIPTTRNRIFLNAYFWIKAEHLRYMDICFLVLLFNEKRLGIDEISGLCFWKNAPKTIYFRFF